MAGYYSVLDPRGFDENAYRRYWFLDLRDDARREFFDPWPYISGRPVESDRELCVAIEKPGDPLDFTYGYSFVPLIVPRVASLLTEMAADDIQLIPARLPDGQCLFILVVIRLEDCLDYHRSDVTRFTREHACAIGRPEREGKPHMVKQLIIDPSRTHDRKLLRVQNWSGDLIVREDIKQTLEKAAVTGVTYASVT